MKEELKGLFTAEELAPFMRPRNDVNILTLTILYSIAAAIIVFYPRFGSATYALFGYLVMGAVQHWLGTYVHEAAHLNLFTHRRLNDFFGHALCAAPLLSYLKDYRYFHFEHHRHTGDLERDPELRFYRAMGVKPAYGAKTEILRQFIFDLIGVTYVRSLRYVLNFFGEKRKLGIIEKPTLGENALLLVWITLIPFLMWRASLLTPFLIFWVLPIFTITPTLLRWHGFGEHIREHDAPAHENTLTHRLSFLPTLFLYPIHSSYHLEHHLYPQMPWLQLKKFYTWAMKNPKYAQLSRRLTVDGYFFGKRTVVNVAFPLQK